MPTELSEPESAVDQSAEALIEAADRKRRGARRPARPAAAIAPLADAHDAIPTRADPSDADEAESEEKSEVEAKPTDRRQPRRKPLKARKESDVAGPGTVTRGIHAGLESLSWTRGRLVQLGLWGSAAALVITLLADDFAIVFCRWRGFLLRGDLRECRQTCNLFRGLFR